MSRGWERKRKKKVYNATSLLFIEDAIDFCEVQTSQVQNYLSVFTILCACLGIQAAVKKKGEEKKTKGEQWW